MRQPVRLQGFDQQLIWVVVALLALGLVMVYSASVALPDNPKFARYAPTLAGAGGTAAQRDSLALNLLQAHLPTPREYLKAHPGADINAFIGSFAHFLASGLPVAEAAMELAGFDEIDICPWALREGVILNYLDHLNGD